MIILDSVSYTYPSGVEALNKISLQIDEGEFIAIVGENGAGKTTLIKTLNGLIIPNQGNVFIDGINTKNISVAQLAKKVGIVFQNPDHMLFEDTTNAEISYTLKKLGIDENKHQERLDWTLKLLNLESFADRSPFKLSGGERKRVSLGAIIGYSPKYLILDEPTLGQDAIQKANLSRVLKEYKKLGNTVIVVSHDIEWLAESVERMLLFKEGKLIIDGKPEEVFNYPEIISYSSLICPQITHISYLLNKINSNFPKNIVGFDKFLTKFKKFVRNHS